MKAEVPEFAAAAMVPEELCKLESDFALQQLTGVAKRCSEGEFIIFAAPVFGFDVPAPVYVSLYEALRDGRVPNARIVVVQGGVYPGAFDTAKREIVVHQRAACKAAKDAEAAWELLTVLLHEFGHHIDSIIREDLASSEAEEASPLKTDAEGDEGAKLAYALAFFDFDNSVDTEFAQLVSQDYSGPLRVNYKDARNYIKLSQDDEAQRREGKSGDLELFGASGEHVKQRPLESFGHEQIEQGLIAADKFVFDRNTRLRIYFGNWLRDYSQILDPKIIRPPGMPKDLTRYISRDTLTKVVDVLAEEKFVFEAASKKEFAVTKENLGVYRAVEHIDNPTNFDTNARDNRAVDADFEPPPSATYLSIDAGSSMKHYIAASRDYMTAQINKAVGSGKTAEGCRHFGAGLHVLEDYFAHSNFVELSLRKLGYSKVLPWTSKTACKYGYPVVTGMFDSEDVIASVAALFAEPMLTFEPRKPGERTKEERILLILLADHSDQTWLAGYKTMLNLRDKVAAMPGGVYLQAILFYALTPVHLISFVRNCFVHLIGNSVDDAQVYGKGNPNINGSTDPSHSQLAKDHDDHPFHTLGASLAKTAVTQVGKAMAESWKGAAGADPAALAAAYLVHPYDCNWQDETVKTWAQTHQENVQRGESATAFEALHVKHEAAVKQRFREAEKRAQEAEAYFKKYAWSISGEKAQVKP